MDEVLHLQQSHLTQIILDSLTQMFNEKKDKKLHHFEIQQMFPFHPEELRLRFAMQFTKT